MIATKEGTSGDLIGDKPYHTYCHKKREAEKNLRC